MSKNLSDHEKAMSSPYGGNFLDSFTVHNTDYVKKIEPFTEKEYESLKTGLESMGAVLRAKNSKLIVFEFEGMMLQVAKN